MGDNSKDEDELVSNDENEEEDERKRKEEEEEAERKRKEEEAELEKKKREEEEAKAFWNKGFMERRAIIKIEKRKVAAEKLEEAKTKKVAFAIRSKEIYKCTEDDDPPLGWTGGGFIDYEARTIMHIHDYLNEEWWIGRVVDQDTEFGFIPSVKKIKKLDYDRRAANKAPKKEKDIFTKIDDEPYDIVPNIRPIVFVGPALKGFEVTDLMHLALFDFLKTRFPGRVTVIRTENKLNLNKKGAENNIPIKKKLAEFGVIDPNYVFRPSFQNLLVIKLKFAIINKSLMKKIEVELNQVYEATRRLNQFVILDYVKINFPHEIQKSPLAPLIIYIQIKEPVSLWNIIDMRGPDQMETIKKQMKIAEKLVEIDEDEFDLVLDNTQLEDACKKLANFLEHYWTITHYGYVPPPPEPVISEEEAILEAMAIAAFVETDPDVLQYTQARGDTDALLDNMIGAIAQDLSQNELLEGINLNVIHHIDEYEDYDKKKDYFYEKHTKSQNLPEEIPIWAQKEEEPVKKKPLKNKIKMDKIVAAVQA